MSPWNHLGDWKGIIEEFWENQFPPPFVRLGAFFPRGNLASVRELRFVATSEQMASKKREHLQPAGMVGFSAGLPGD